LTRPRLSVALLVRNEARLLPGALRSVQPFADEVIVLDTGSDDGSPDIARDLGARVVCEPDRAVDIGGGLRSIDDFAAARNRSIDLCSGDFVITMDADHRYTPAAGCVIRAALDGEPFHAATFRFHHAASEAAAWEDVIAGRARLHDAWPRLSLLRREAGPWYECAIHECAVNWTRRDGRRCVALDADVVDLGEVTDAGRLATRGARYERMLLAAIAREPDDVHAYAYLAHDYMTAGRLADAAHVANEAVARGLLAHASDGRLRDQAKLGLLLALLLARAGELDAVLAVTADVERVIGRVVPDFDVARAQAYERAGDGRRAAHAYERALSAPCLDFMSRGRVVHDLERLTQGRAA